MKRLSSVFCVTGLALGCDTRFSLSMRVRPSRALGTHKYRNDYELALSMKRAPAESENC
jgi:hypothetical protein